MVCLYVVQICSVKTIKIQKVYISKVNNKSVRKDRDNSKYLNGSYEYIQCKYIVEMYKDVVEYIVQYKYCKMCVYVNVSHIKYRYSLMLKKYDLKE